MKNFYTIVLLLFALLYLSSCSDDKVGDDPKNNEHDHSENTVQSWICNTLCEWYLWNTDVQAKTPNYNLGYNDFFESLLSDGRNDGKSKDNRYSYITRQSASTRIDQNDEYSFGMSVIYGNVTVNNGGTVSRNMHAVVTYVIENSPAWNAGIRRGHFIKAINNTDLTSNNFDELNRFILPGGIAGAIPSQVRIKGYQLEWDGKTVDGDRYAVGNIIDNLDVVINPAAVVDDPSHYYNIYTLEGGKKVGYLVYNMFERGERYEFDDSLKKIFKEFKNEGVNELILDLRYNGGGYVSSCQLLSSMIVREDKLGTVFQNMTYNESITKRYGVNYGRLNFLQVNQMNQGVYGTESGTNLNLNRLYVIAGQFSASASEAVINSLRGVGMEVIHLGEKTEGKNVGMTLFEKESDGYKYEMYPVTFYSCNAEGKADFEKGFEPLFPYSEYANLNFPEFGDYEKDIMLNYALYHIYTGSFRSAIRSAEEPKADKILLSTFDYKRKGMIMDME